MVKIREEKSFYWEIAALVLFLGFFAATTGYQEGTAGKMHFLLLPAAMGLHGLSRERSLRAGKKGLAGQWAAVHFGMAITFLAAGFRGREVFLYFGRRCYFLVCLVIGGVCLGLFLRELWYCRKLLRRPFCLRDRLGICVLLLMAAGIGSLQAPAALRWDGAFLYKYLHQLNLTAVFQVNLLAFCNHLSMSYVAFNKLAEAVFGSLSLGMTALNFALYLGSVLCVYLILRRQWERLSDPEAALLTAVYAFSPFLFGLVHYNYWDFWVIALFPIVVYFALCKKWVLFFFFSLVFCFVKETAVVAYAFFCFGLLLTDFWGRDKKSLRFFLKTLLGGKEYLGMLAVGVVWLWAYVSLPHWDGVGAFAFHPRYMLQKLSVLFGLNFNWLLFLAGTGLFVCLARRGERGLVRTLFPLFCSDGAFLVFSCLFDTVNHARYIDTHIVVLNLTLILCLGGLSNRVFRCAAGAALTALMAASSFRTLDPVTLFLFERHNVGETTVVSTTENEFLSDSVVYNRQYLCLDGALNLALGEAAAEGAPLCFPAIYNSTWFFDGIVGGDADRAEYGALMTCEYWDAEKQGRMLYGDGDDIPLEIWHLTESSDLDAVLDGRTGYYFCIPGAGEEQRRQIEERMEVLEEKVFEYQGWEITRLKFIGK